MKEQPAAAGAGEIRGGAGERKEDASASVQKAPGRQWLSFNRLLGTLAS